MPSDWDNTAAIVGGVLGTVTVLAVVAMMIVVLLRNRGGWHLTVMKNKYVKHYCNCCCIICEGVKKTEPPAIAEYSMCVFCLVNSLRHILCDIFQRSSKSSRHSSQY